MKFDPPQQANEVNHGSSKYLSLKDGESVRLILIGELHKKWEIWLDGKSKEVPSSTPGARIRYLANVVVANGIEFEVKVFRFGRMIQDQLANTDKDLREEGLDITKVKLKVSRTGSKLDTNYQVTNLGPVDSKTLSKIQSFKLHILGPKTEDLQNEDPYFDNEVPMPSNDDLPF